MGLARVAVWLFLVAILCPGQPDAESRIALLMRVHGKMRKTMARFPNYTCNEIITRSISSGTPLRCEYMDRLRLEVAVVGGKELFSWPGAARFERDDPFEIVGSGPTGSGDFANFTKAVLVSDAPFYTYGGEEVRAGRPAVRYDYRISQAKSGYTLRSGIEHAIVGYHGSFWVDPATEQVLALEVHVDEIPEAFDSSDVKTLIEYKVVRLGDEEFAFPGSSELTIKHRRSTVVSRNRIEFSGCRQYTAESTLRFGVSGLPASSAAPAPAPPPTLPPGLTLDVALENPIDVASSAAGDAISATLLHPLQAGTLHIPKGAKLLGRMLRFEIHLDKISTLAALDFSQLEFGSTRLEFRGRLRHFDRLRGLGGGSLASLKSVSARDLEVASAQEWKSPAVFTMWGNRTQIPAGFQMKWETTAAP